MTDTGSILDDIKKVLGLDVSNTDFDDDVIMHVNSCFGILAQISVGPYEGFAITDNGSTWSDYTDNIVLLSPVKSYIYQRTRLMFDPPNTSFGLEALQRVITELESRLNMIAEYINPPSDPFA